MWILTVPTFKMDLERGVVYTDMKFLELFIMRNLIFASDSMHKVCVYMCS